MNKPFTEWTKKEFEALPCRKWDEDIGIFNSLIILPTKRKHDSGYRIMDFVAVREGEPLCRLSGCSDVVHIDGIGGFGIWSPKTVLPSKISPKSWSIDCLPKSGLLQLFCRRTLTAGPALSSFEVWGEASEKR